MEWYFIVLIVVCSLAVVYFAVCLAISRVILKMIVKPKAHTLDEGRAFQIKQENWDFSEYDSVWKKTEFELKSFDGLSIKGEYIENAVKSERRKIAVVCHGHTWNRITSVKYGEIFYRLGYDVVLYDNRYFGLSEGGFTTLGQFEREDLVAVAEYVQKLYGKDCFLVLHGESMGAATVLSALPKLENVAMAVADCPFSDTAVYFRELTRSRTHLPAFPTVNFASAAAKRKYKYVFKSVKPIADLAATDVPICFIHGDADRLIYKSHSEKLYAACRNKDSELHIFTGALHARSFLKDKTLYRQTVAAFVRKIEEKNGIGH